MTRYIFCVIAVLVQPLFVWYVYHKHDKRQAEILPFNHFCERRVYDVTVDNKDFLRYSGEINIILKNLEPDRRVNVIGHVNISKIIVEQLKKGKPFCFIKKDDE